LELSPRTLNCLKRGHITRVGEILEMCDEELLKIRNFGEKSLSELRDKLIERGIAPERTAQPETEAGAGAELQEAVSSLSNEDIQKLIGIGDAPLMAQDLDTQGTAGPEDDKEEEAGELAESEDEEYSN
jgi:hypothetical protein